MAVEVESVRTDLSKIAPSLRYLYGDGMPVKTYIAANGVRVEVFASQLPKTDEERQKRLNRMNETAHQIIRKIAAREAQNERE